MVACSTPSLSHGDSERVTLIIVNARAWTADPAHLWAEAIAVAGDRVAAVGSTDEIRAMADEGVQTIDARGRLLVPGFIDSHVHFIDGGFRLASVQLRDARTREELADRLAAFAKGAPEGTWITGGDWDHERWGGELPQHEWIDPITPHHPVWVHRLDGHMALANSAALRAAGVTRDTPDVPGGTIVRDARGEPTGVLKDNAMRLVTRVVPEPTPEQADRALDAAMRHVAAQGVTTVHNMGSWADLETFSRALKAERLSTRIYAVVPLADWEQLRDLIRTRRFGQQGRGDKWLRVGGLKAFVDGSLGSHTALFEQPFSDAPNDRGLSVTPLDTLYENIAAADVAYLQVMVHAIGDRANRELLDIYARVAADNGKRDRRWRIEHAQHLRREDISRFAELGVIASMQPYHAIDDGRWAEEVIGAERAKTTYAFRSLLDAGATVAFGSDWFVAPPSPLEGIYAAVTRRTLDGKHPNGWVPEQKITVEEALRAYTHDGAIASFDEAVKGTITPGKLADFVLIDRDLFEVPPDEIREARILWTMVGGRIVYERNRR
ncbi:MAG: amidohydrolase family protein [Luteitalea sp.]|nr:amidohydrolase family protein [Luteitalea sp.]